MTSSGSFAATILESSTGALAGYASSLVLERHPEFAERYGPRPMPVWKTHLNQRLLELAAAVRTDEPAIFAGRVRWARKAFVARGLPDADILLSLESLADVLRERLPAPALAPVEVCLSEARAVFEDAVDVEETGLDPERPADREALEYLALVLAGDTRTATDRLLTLADEGMTPREVYERVLIPAEREIGRLWHAGKANVAEEHLVTTTTRRAMAALSARFEPGETNGKTVVIAAVAGNAHELGARALADFFDFAGWRVVFLGADLPASDLVHGVRFFGADLLILSATLSTQLAEVERVIAMVKEVGEEAPPVMVGGLAFADAPELWKRVGADLTATSVDEALERAARAAGL